MTHEALISATGFFAHASGDDVAALAKSASVVDLVRGDVVFEEGSRPDALYVVVSGRVAITLEHDVDNRESVIALMGAGDLFGDLAILDGGPRSASARALEPSSVLRIPAEAVLSLLRSNNALLWDVVGLLAERLRHMDEAIADSVFLDVTGRTAKRLLELSGGKDDFTLPVTQEELAGMVGASRERVNKAISSFIRLGWLEQQDRRYRILMRDRLEVRAS